MYTLPTLWPLPVSSLPRTRIVAMVSAYFGAKETNEVSYSPWRSINMIYNYDCDGPSCLIYRWMIPLLTTSLPQTSTLLLILPTLAISKNLLSRDGTCELIYTFKRRGFRIALAIMDIFSQHRSCNGI